MTREEFLEDVVDYDWYNLIHYCWDNGYDEYVENVCSDDDRDNDIFENLEDIVGNFSDWHEVKGWLNNLDDESSTGYWIRDNWGEYIEADAEDLQRIVDDLMDQMEIDGVFDDNDDDNDNDNDNDNEPYENWTDSFEENEPDADVEVMDLFVFKL